LIAETPTPQEKSLAKYGLKTQDIEWLSTPVGFAEGFLGMQLYEKQKQALQGISRCGAQVSFASCNDGGKTRFVAAASILWHLFMWPAGTVAATSGKFSQLEDQLMPALWEHRQKFPNWTWYDSPYIATELVETGAGGFFVGFSTNKPGLAEGFHARGDDKPLYFLTDEAKSAQPWLEGVVEGRIHPTRLMLMSSQGFAEGWFYDSQRTRRKDFIVVEQRAEDCPHISLEHIRAVRRKWGNSGLADSILGHGFMALVENAVIDYKEIDALLLDPPKPAYGEIHGFWDFAWSNDGDESTFFLRNGNVVTMEAAFRVEGLHPLCDRVVQECLRCKFTPETAWQLSGDEGGGGQLVMDELDRRGWRFRRWNNGGAAADADHFQDAKSEMWYNAGEYITMHQAIIPDDPELRIQLINRKRIPGTQGRLAIETKKDMKARGVQSPDRADGFVGCLMPQVGYFKGANEPQTFTPMQLGGFKSPGS
jgi:hypothetical protein